MRQLANRRTFLAWTAGAGFLGTQAAPALAAPRPNRSASGVILPAQETPRQGGTLRIALTGDPPSLDMHQTPDMIVLLVASHLYETLFTWDSQYRPVPQLAESYELSDDGLLIRLGLRRHVPFHNGEELRAGDVIASIERWGRIVGLGEALLESTQRMVAAEPHVVEFRLKRPFGVFPVALARALQGCAIYPTSVLDRSDDTSLAAYVGTGPYRFGEWQPDSLLRLEDFPEYASPEGDQDGYAGRTTPHLDQLEFIPVRDEAARVAGMQAGSFHYLETISPDHEPTFRDDPAVVTAVPPADSWLNMVLNLRSPLLADLRVRRALQLALDHEPIMQAAFGDGYYELNPDLVPGAAIWESDAGAEYYNQHRVDGARELLAEAGYDGAPLRVMTTREIQQEYNGTLVIAQQWEAAGVTVDLQVYDGAALSDRRQDEALWETYTAWASFRPDPVMRNITCSANGWWCDAAKDRLLADLQSESDYETRFALWERVQAEFYEDVPRLKIGSGRRLMVHAATLHDIGPTALQPDFARAWLEA